MPNLPSVSIVLGTRPEAIKLAPVIKEFKACDEINTRVLLTGQHKEMVSQVMDLFGLEEDQDLNLMRPSQTLTHLTCGVLEGLQKDFELYPPALVLVQGDTTTAFAAALAAFYKQIPVGHVEAGLRTKNLLEPFPEEANRRLVSQLAQLHFAPTTCSAQHLNNSGVLGEVLVTGNTVVDALLMISKRSLSSGIKEIDWDKKRVILATVHRRENWGEPLKQIIDGFRRILDAHNDVILVLPLHKNPIVREPLKAALGSHPRAVLTDALDYDQLVAVMEKCFLVLTDSGGLQEEAPAFGKPVLVLRNTTERAEAIEAGTALLVGTDSDSIFLNTLRLLEEQSVYENMSKAENPFGDGKASGRILKASMELLGVGCGT